MTTTETTPTTGILLPCPRCGCGDASILLHLADVTFQCGDCDESFEASEVRVFIEKWTAVLSWLDQMPRS